MLDSSHRVWCHPLRFDDGPPSSDQGLPLGDGRVGVSLWGKANKVYLSLDRADLWDLRPIPEYEGEDYRWDLVAAAHRAGDHDQLKTLLEEPYNRAGPTRLSAGRLELTFAAPAAHWYLERATGLARVDFADGSELCAIITAAGSVGRLQVKGTAPTVRLITPPFGAPPEDLTPDQGINLSRHNAWDLGYPPPQLVAEDTLDGFFQKGFGDFAFAVAVAHEKKDDLWQAAWHIGAGPNEDLLSTTVATVKEALTFPFSDEAQAVADWWSDYWSRGTVRIPDPLIERTYYAGLAQFGAAARRGCPPAALQGLWTTDDGRLPPWKGDYHHDLNSQMTYWPAYVGDQLDAGLGFLDWLWETRQGCRDWTRQFYEVAGLNVPMTADIANRQLGGWRQYTHSVSTSAWLAHHFHLHWRYSQDRQFLKDRAYPYLKEVCDFVEAISETRDVLGFRSVALSSSPEVGDNRPEAWVEGWSSYDLSLFRWVLGAASDMAKALGLADQSAHWQTLEDEFPPYSLSAEGALLIATGVPYPQHHRHFSHAVGIHPLGLFDSLEGTAADRHLANATVAELDRASGDFWMGYSHAWAAALSARIGDGETARKRLRDYQTAFVFPNGFHANGDWRRLGYGKAPFGAFTIEGAMGAADAVQTMLIQSAPGRIRLFPAIPADWQDVSFEGLRADGAVLVSAAVENGRLCRVILNAQSSGPSQLAYRDQVSALELNLIAGQALILDENQITQLQTAATLSAF
jgi:alpha-L-fucosidase 2